ncbi:hypothetical protein Pcinc_024013 [Petrolisthes cinctipes]|uniref:Lipocalin/cytosolic fatty-acid binding domain-containing protein n=1 Tax=Petrolisthes cinctipes TaxID=88211 RepID=A0AAE1FAT9_PETCI|nr:hypothetical protein Pcinc_024013 [Petrolisthes cinctipes]
MCMRRISSPPHFRSFLSGAELSECGTFSNLSPAPDTTGRTANTSTPKMHSAREVVTSGGRGMMVVMVLLSALTVLETSAHSIDMGRCRTDVQGVSDFQQEAFAGKWYVIELSSTSSKCFTMDFKSTSGGYSVVDSQLLWVGGIVDTDIMVETDHVYITTGNGQMTVRSRVVSPFSDPSVFVLDTDYTSYAALHECGNMVFLRRVEGAILSRTPTLDPEIVSQLREQLSATGVNVERMDSMTTATALRTLTLFCDPVIGLVLTREMPRPKEELKGVKPGPQEELKGVKPGPTIRVQMLTPPRMSCLSE